MEQIDEPNINEIIEYDLSDVLFEFSNRDEWQELRQIDSYVPHMASPQNLAHQLDFFSDRLKDERSWEQDDISLDLYYRDIRKFKPLRSKNELNLILEAQTGDAKALESVVKSNLRYVVYVAKKYQNLGLPLNDLIGEGNIGLIKGIMNVDTNYPFYRARIHDFVGREIYNALSRYNRLAWMPPSISKCAWKAKKMLERYYAEYGDYTPEGTGGSEEQFEMAIQDRVEFSIEFLLTQFGPSGEYYIDHLLRYNTLQINTFDESEKTSELYLESLRIDIQDALALLTPREADIIRMSFGINCEAIDLKEIAHKYALSRERVRQIANKAIQRLKIKHLQALLEYFG